MNKAIVATILILSLPVYRAGPERGITGWNWLWHHLNEGINHIPVTYIPVEDYKTAFEKYYGVRNA